MIFLRFEVIVLVLLLCARASTHILQHVSDTELEAVNRRLTDEKGERLLLKNDVENLMVEMKEVQRELKGSIPNRNIGTSRQEIYFNAKLSKHTTVTDGHTVIFDMVVENVGDCYNEITGIFRATVSGMYQFSITMTSRGKGQYAHIQLMKNGKEIGRVFCGSDTTNWAQVGSLVIFTHLDVDDEVYARELPEHTGHLYGNNWCSFAGGLV